MILRKLLEHIAPVNIPDGLLDEEISVITDDSRKIQKNALFVCIRGGKFDGHSVAADCLEKGAAAVITEKDLGLDKQITVTDTRLAYARLCAAWFGFPYKKLRLIGVTGTNGKTTVTSLIKYILTKSGYKTGLIGTVQNEIGDEILPAENTTPFAFEFMEILSRMADAGCEFAVIEASSFGLMQKRIAGIEFELAVFTNLTQDHLDYHETMEDYYQAKRLLFDMCKTAVCNIDCKYGKRLFDELGCVKYSCSIKTCADFYARDISLSARGTEFVMQNGDESFKINAKMTGGFNVSNIVCAVAACACLNISDSAAGPARLAEDYAGAKGRCEIIPSGRDFTVICDYAHTPDAVENVLEAVREYTEKRLIALFGCGGNRDKGKRPKMAEKAAQAADLLIITSDNPRDENSEEIIADIIKGLNGFDTPYVTVADRKNAIFHALDIAESGDVIVLLGKGHEDYQVFENNRRIHFDEREIVGEWALRAVSGGRV